MRLVAGVLALTLFAPFVRAEDPRAPQAVPAVPAVPDATQGKVPLRVVRVMPESRQALLFDRRRATHVLAEVGATIEGYTVEAIDGDEVTLRFEGTTIVLAAPARSDRRRARDERARATAPRPAGTKAEPAPAPIDPYGEPAPVDAYAEAAPATGPFPVDAYAEAAPATGPFPVDAYAEAVPAAGPFPVDAYAEAPGDDARPVAAAPASPASGPAASPARAASAAPGRAAPMSVRLSRAEVDAELADFSRLATAIRGSFSPSGMVLAEVTEGSIFHRAGLRAGDTIAAVDGAPLRSLDDAANLYARAAGARAVTVQILRAGKPIALHVAIR